MKGVPRLGRLASFVLLSLLLAIVYCYLYSATLNLDDLQYVEWLPRLVAQRGHGETLKLLLLNEDVGRDQLRTYGLARALQFAHWELFGVSSFAVFVTIAVLHALGACLLYLALGRWVESKVFRIVLAVVWFASPAVFPIERTLHHFLYTMGPYYALLGWAALVAKQRSNIVLGTALLTSAWMLGEAAIPTIYLVAILIGLDARGRNETELARGIAIQLALSLTLLVGYVVYQRIAIHDPSLVQRVVAAPPTSFADWVARLDSFIYATGQLVVALAGYPFFDAELGPFMVGGLDYVQQPLFWLVVALSVTALSYILFEMRLGTDVGGRWLAALSTIISASSTLILYAVIYLSTGQLPMTGRYIPPIFTALLIAAPLAAYFIAPALGRVIAVLVASICLASSLGLGVAILDVHARIDQRVAWLEEQRRAGREALLVVHKAPAPDDKSIGFGAWPGLGSPFDYFVADPFRSFWTTSPYATNLLGFKFVASAYKELDAERVELTVGPRHLTLAKSMVAVGGLVSPTYPIVHPPVSLFKDWEDFAARKK